jgi:hypothetical protein
MNELSQVDYSQLQAVASKQISFAIKEATVHREKSLLKKPDELTAVSSRDFSTITARSIRLKSNRFKSSIGEIH